MHAAESHLAAWPLGDLCWLSWSPGAGSRGCRGQGWRSVARRDPFPQGDDTRSPWRERIVSINGMAGCGAGRRARGGREQMWDCFMNYIDV